MTRQPDQKQALCLNFCAYYKPGRNEEPGCQGSVLVELLMDRGLQIDFEMPHRPRDRARDATLVERLCRSCPFCARDCDFMDNRELPPCGGFVLLAQLLAAKKITIDDMP